MQIRVDSRAVYVNIGIFNITDQKVCTPVNEYKQVGVYTIIWVGRNQYGDIVSSGMYLIKMAVKQTSANDFVIV